MNEKELQGRLKRITVLVIITVAVLLIAASMISASLKQVLSDTTEEQMKSETDEYKINILRKLDADLQTLQTLASFFKFSDTMSTGEFAEGVYEANKHNGFSRMGYFRKDGTGIRVTKSQDINLNVKVSELDESFQEIIEKAWEGESSVSRIYYDENLDRQTFAYAVPVYQNEAVIGVLGATNSIEVFEEILDDSTTLYGKGYVQLIGNEGNYLVRSERSVVQGTRDTIYQGGYLSKEEEQKIRSYMEEGSSAFSHFTYGGKDYRIYLEPVGVNGWYLFCTDTTRSANGSVYMIVLVTRIILYAVIALAAFLLIYGYCLFKQNTRRLIKIAYHDPCTDAYNRVRFMQETNAVLEEDRSYTGIEMNIRQFKFINEIFGRTQANRLLVHVKDVLEENLQEGEFFGRDSADRFLILMRGTDRETIYQRLIRIMDAVGDFAKLKHLNYKIRLYCGAAFADAVEEVAELSPADTLFTHTSFAINTAREGHQNTVWFYNTDIHKDEILQNYVETHMEQALQNKEFKLYLQPKKDLRTGRIGSAEALVRWQTGDGTMIFPNKFIPLFEQNGFCVRLDLYMLEQVFRQIREWIDEGREPIPISVNQSKLLFYEEDYMNNLDRMIEKYDIPPRLITLEILEGLALENVDELNRKLAKIRAKGFRVSMDDFGSGYSSFNTLGKLQIDELKLDKAFLQELTRGSKERQEIIMEQIVEMAKRLHISTVVEGVETLENEELIYALGCDYGQGYLYSRPVSAREFSDKYMEE